MQPAPHRTRRTNLTKKQIPGDHCISRYDLDTHTDPTPTPTRAPQEAEKGANPMTTPNGSTWWCYYSNIQGVMEATPARHLLPRDSGVSATSIRTNPNEGMVWRWGLLTDNFDETEWKRIMRCVELSSGVGSCLSGSVLLISEANVEFA